MVFVTSHVIRVVFFVQLLELFVSQRIQTRRRLALLQLFQFILRKGCKVIFILVLECCDGQLTAVFQRMRCDVEPVALKSPNDHTLSSFLYRLSRTKYKILYISAPNVGR